MKSRDLFIAKYERRATLYILGVQLGFRRFPIDGFRGKWWSK